MIFYSIFTFPLLFISSVSSAILDSSSQELVRKQNPAAIGPVSQLHVSNKLISPDGYLRSATLFNGQFPGPLIQATKARTITAMTGDHFSIEVLNALSDDNMPLETSVHFHGLFQRNSDWADGPTYVTQCPIRQYGRFVQKFNVTDQTGTYWYHTHHSASRCAGAAGPLVIYDPEDPLGHLYDVDDETTVVTLGDWYHLYSVPSQVFGLPNSTLINGQGRYPGGPPAPLSVINVQQGFRYRLRVIGMSCEAAFNFTIDGHRMTIIEVDGNEVKPTDVDRLPVLAGQRYSVVVTANKPVGNYWIRASSDLHGATFDNGQSMAILQYYGAPDEDPKSSPGPCELGFDESDLQPLVDPGAPGTPELGEADVNIALAPGFDVNTGNFTLGGASWVNPSVPVLLQMLSGTHPLDLLPQKSVYILPANKTVEISFPKAAAAPGGPHPVHLHGNNFHVVRAAGSATPNFVNPVRRDVVSLGDSPTDNVTIRFVTDNFGPWFLHCHLDYHLLHGFAVVMAVAPDETVSQESKVAPQDWKELCQQQGDSEAYV